MRIVALFLVLLILGCTPTPKDDPSLYRTGKDGLVVSFAKDSPPAKVYRGSNLNLVLEIRNKGATGLDAGQGTVYLSGFEPAAIKFSNYNPTGKYASMPVPRVNGKNQYVPEGGYAWVEFKESGKVEVPFGDTTKQKLMATTCYPYQTLATPTVCVLSDPTQIYTDKLCEPKAITLTDQGGPIAVTKVEEEVGENLLNFVITVQNVGGGRIINKESFGKCPFALKHEDVNVVNFDVQLTGSTASCTPTDKKVRLIDGKGVFFCSFPVQMQAAYTSQLNILLDYYYSSSVTRDVEIVLPPGTRISPGGGVTTPGGTTTPGTSQIYVLVNSRSIQSGDTVFISPGYTDSMSISAQNVAYCTVSGINEPLEGGCSGTVLLSPSQGSVTITGYDTSGRQVAQFTIIISSVTDIQ